MTSRELLSPADLTRAQAFYINELTKVIMINKDKDFVFASFHVMALSHKGFNDSQ